MYRKQLYLHKMSVNVDYWVNESHVNRQVVSVTKTIVKLFSTIVKLDLQRQSLTIQSLNEPEKTLELAKDHILNLKVYR